MIENALAALGKSSLCTTSKASTTEHYSWSGSILPGKSLEGAIEELAESAKQRALLQERWAIGDHISLEIKAIFQYLVEQRGWDLGVAFATGRPPDSVDFDDILRASSGKFPAFDQERLHRIFASILQNPTTRESALLSELGQVSFALELAFHSPATTLTNKTILPRHIYFDASVLLPAIVQGHPFQSLYDKAIKRLREAATKAAHPVQLIICSV